MRSTALFTVFSCSLALLGCSSNDPLSTGTTTGTPGDDPLALTVHTGEFQVDPGDSFECFYTDVTTDHDIAAISGAAEQGPRRLDVSFVRELQHQVLGAGRSLEGEQTHEGISVWNRGNLLLGVVGSEGETPFLHAYASNVGAIELYKRLGFDLRCNVVHAMWSRDG